MADFTEIKTQEEFDARIKDRLERERAKFQAEIEKAAGLQGQIDALTQEKAAWSTEKSGLDAKINELAGKLNEANGRIKAAELDAKKLDIAMAAGLPLELRHRLQGSTEEELKKDAAALVEIFGKSRTTLPGTNPEGAPDGARSTTQKQQDAAFKQMLENITKS